MTVRVGVIGTGIMGADHVRTLATAVRGAAVTAVSDADQARATAVAADITGCTVHADPLDLIQAADVDAVVVAAPDETHEPLVLTCLAARKPVLCEKPLAATAEAALRIVVAEDRIGQRLIQVGFMRRFDPAYVELKRALDAGELGAPLLVHCAHRNVAAPPWFASELLLQNAGIHEIDVARWLLGEEISTVTVHLTKASRHGNGIQDPQFALLRTQSGVLVDIEVFMNARYGYDIRCELVGEQGSSALPSHVTRDWRDRFAEAYRAELQSFVDGVAAGGVGGPGAWDGYVASAVAETGVESLKMGVPLPVKVAAR